jgi:hypothetical protein
MQALFKNLVPPSSCFSSTVAPKMRFLSHWMQNVINKPIKNDIPNSGIHLKKIIQQSLITILPMFLAVEFRPHKIEAVFCWVRGSFYRFGL